MLQLMRARQQCGEVQQQLQAEREQQGRAGSDLAHMTAKVHSLEYDLGGFRHSLQVQPPTPPPGFHGPAMS